MNQLHAKSNTHFSWGHAVLVIVIAASLFLGSFNPAAAATGYYVSPSGNNANPGTQSQPWQTVQYAVSHAGAGDTIFLRAGTYNEAVSISASGQSGSPITLTNYNGESATINGSANPAITGGGKYWTIKGLTLTSASDRTVKLNSATNYTISNNKIIGAVYIWGSYNTLEGNDIDGSQHKGNENGVMDDSTNSHHNIFRRNTIHDFNNRGIWSQWFTHDNTIEYNTVYNMSATDGMCIDLDAATNVTYRHVVRGNIVHDCAQTGIELENSYDTIVENNIVYNTGLEGIQIISYSGCKVGGESNQYGESDGDCRGDLLNSIVRQNLVYNAGRVGAIVSYQAAGVKVYNNTLLSGTSVGLYLKNDTDYGHDWEVVGNIFYNNPRAEISIVNPASLARDEYNLFYHTTSNKAYELRGASTSFYTLAEWQSKTGKGTRSVEKDPLFVNPGSFDAHLRSGSPAIDASTNTSITSDLDGKPRPSGSGYDMGAYEYTGSSTAPTATKAPTNAPTATKLPTNAPTATKLPTNAPTPAGGGTWVLCANENRTCSFSGTAQVRYGANGVYNTVTATNSIACSNTVFGDPVPGVAKTCSYLSGSGGATATKAPTTAPTATRVAPTATKAPTRAPTATKVPTNAPTATKVPTSAPTQAGGTWVFCANEYQTCSFSGTTQVRFGAGSAYNYLTATNSIACANEIFGDPAPGKVKTCSYLSSGGALPTATKAPANAPTATRAPATAVPPSGNLLSFKPAADAYVQSSYPTRNYGTVTKLYEDDSPKMISYLRFNVQGLDGKSIQKAVLKLYPAQTTLRAVNVSRVDDNTWTETGLTYQNAPALGELIAASSKTLTNGVLIIDVTTLVQGNGEINLALSNVSTGGFAQYARESGSRAPVLEITVQ